MIRLKGTGFLTSALVEHSPVPKQAAAGSARSKLAAGLDCRGGGIVGWSSGCMAACGGLMLALARSLAG